jgi:hypothetical protein
MGTNGGLNNRHITFKGMVTKEKKELRNIKITNEWYELVQLPTYNITLGI